jgi:hypothetical protein
MSLSKCKCWYSNNCLHFLKRPLPLLLNGQDFKNEWINFHQKVVMASIQKFKVNSIKTYCKLSRIFQQNKMAYSKKIDKKLAPIFLSRIAPGPNVLKLFTAVLLL